MKNNITLKVRDLLKHEFISGSLVMVIGSNVYNFSQLIYHFLAGRFLGKASYGDLATIISILGFIAIVQLAFNLTVVKFIASEKDSEKLSSFIRWVYKWSLILGLVAGSIVLVSASAIAEFLNITNLTSILLLAPILFFYITATTGRSILQGLLRFDKFVYSLLTEAIGKIIFLIVLLFAGYAVLGALGAFLIGALVSFLITTWFIRKFLFGPILATPEILPLIKYSAAVLVQGLALTSMYSTDLLLVKHFFAPELAGQYAALTILGRVVFFGASPITHVMFPLVAKRYLNKEKYHNILYLSILLVLLFSLGVTFFYWLMPTLFLGFLYGKNFLDGGSLLWFFGIFMTMLSLAMLLTQFFLSINKTKPVYLFVLAAVSQAVLIWFFHSSLLMVIQLSILTSSLLVFVLSVYFLCLQRSK